MPCPSVEMPADIVDRSTLRLKGEDRGDLGKLSVTKVRRSWLQTKAPLVQHCRGDVI